MDNWTNMGGHITKILTPPHTHYWTSRAWANMGGPITYLG